MKRQKGIAAMSEGCMLMQLRPGVGSMLSREEAPWR